MPAGERKRTRSNARRARREVTAGEPLPRASEKNAFQRSARALGGDSGRATNVAGPQLHACGGASASHGARGRSCTRVRRCCTCRVCVCERTEAQQTRLLNAAEQAQRLDFRQQLGRSRSALAAADDGLLLLRWRVHLYAAQARARHNERLEAHGLAATAAHSQPPFPQPSSTSPPHPPRRAARGARA